MDLVDHDSNVREKFQRWLSPPNPWNNHRTAREVRHLVDAQWITQGDVFKQWKSTGSLLWVNGLCAHLYVLCFPTADTNRRISWDRKDCRIVCVTTIILVRCSHRIDSSSIIENLKANTDTSRPGPARPTKLAIFYFSFSDAANQDAYKLLSSVLLQLSQTSHQFSDILSSVHSSHGDGTEIPSIDALLKCLKTMLALQDQGTIYVVLDAVDECPNTFKHNIGRERVLEIVKELIELGHPHFRLCVTSRPETDIEKALESLKPHTIPLDNQREHLHDLTKYVQLVVSSDAVMQNWPERTKNLVIEKVPNIASGMYVMMFMMLRITFSRASGFDVHTFSWKHCARSYLPILNVEGSWRNCR